MNTNHTSLIAANGLHSPLSLSLTVSQKAAMKNPFSFLFTGLSSTSHPTGLSKHPYLEKNNVQTFNYSVVYVSLCSDSHRAVACSCSGGLKLNFLPIFMTTQIITRSFHSTLTGLAQLHRPPVSLADCATLERRRQRSGGDPKGRGRKTG